MDNVNHLKAAVTAAVGVLTALWGWFGWLVLAWWACMAIDYVSGSAAALKAGEWSSKMARDGIWHKLGEIVTVLVAGILDMVISTILAEVPEALPITYTVLLCPLVVVWYILTEAGSIIENVGAMGAPVPKWLAQMVARLKDRVDENAQGDEGKEK